MTTENKITVAIRKADRAAGTMLNACKAVAETIMTSEDWGKSQPKAEAARMVLIPFQTGHHSNKATGTN